MILFSNMKNLRKAIFASILFTVLTLVITGIMFTREARAAEVEFETFLKSVNAGEFILSTDDNEKLTRCVESGNTAEAMEIYKDYFSKEGQMEAAMREAQIQMEDTEENAAAEVETVIVPDASVTNDTDASVKNDAAPLKSDAAPVKNETVSAKLSETVRDSKPLSDNAADINTSLDKAGEKPNVVDQVLKDAIVAETVIAGEVISSIIPKPAKSTEPVSEELVYGLTASDYDALCRIVEAEAGGESSDGKVMVANVVMNRVYSNVFPNTVNEVVAQHGQFSPYRNGSFKRAKPSESTIIAVNKALSGVKLSNALYFKAKRTGLKWGRRELVSICGNHAFYN